MPADLQNVNVLKVLYAPESYFQYFLQTIYKKLGITQNDLWIFPNELYQQIQRKDAKLFGMIERFFCLHKEWYDNFNDTAKQKIAADKLNEIKDYMKKNY
ncbi:hypothetical protein [Fibrobacter sp.]|uniref:hypothetical protein n=1 Tax=Fibrobacter sp. TaxID=35828 RepID=UPI003868D784